VQSYRHKLSDVSRTAALSPTVFADDNPTTAIFLYDSRDRPYKRPPTSGSNSVTLSSSYEQPRALFRVPIIFG
jgi:hypothetical protein